MNVEEENILSRFIEKLVYHGTYVHTHKGTQTRIT